MRKERSTGKSCVKIEFPANAARALLDAGGRKKSDGRTTKGRIFKWTLSIKFVLDQLKTIVELYVHNYDNSKEGWEQPLVNGDGDILYNFYLGSISRKGTTITQSKRSATIGCRVAYNFFCCQKCLPDCRKWHSPRI